MQSWLQKGEQERRFARSPCICREMLYVSGIRFERASLLIAAYASFPETSLD
jgi:hypothetical protein